MATYRRMGTGKGFAHLSSLIIRETGTPPLTDSAKGQIYYNTTTKEAFVYNGSNWDILNHKFLGGGGLMSLYTDGDDNDFIVHTFKASGYFFSGGVDVDYLIVAGGGGGGARHGGGGGAGGFKTAASLTVPAGTHTVTVGAGGRGGVIGQRGISGQNSVVGSLLTAYGGGGGGCYGEVTLGDGYPGKAGGSGGGGVADIAGGAASPSGQGNAGGAGRSHGGYRAGGGGGGASAVGTDASGSAASMDPGDGGAGENNVMGLDDAKSLALSAAAQAGVIDSSVRYYAGGGGGTNEGTSGTDGDGGVGGGGKGGSSRRGHHGITNSGGGGGAGDHRYDYFGGHGGSGIVILRYAA